MKRPTKADIADLKQAAHQALRNAHSPYSKVRVGASVLTNEGLVFAGANVENASFGATLCAERSAIVSAVSQGFKDFSAIVVMTESRKPWAPCGMCRQVMLEFMSPKTPVILVSTKGSVKHLTLAQLTPMAFSPRQMGHL